MANRSSRYKQMERTMCLVLLVNFTIFLFYLLFASLAIGFLKILTGIVSVLVGLLILAYLYMTKELLRRRSLWMGVSAVSIVLCTLVSLILNYPG